MSLNEMESQIVDAVIGDIDQAVRAIVQDSIQGEARDLYRRVYAEVAGRRSERVTAPEHFGDPAIVAHAIAETARTDYLQLFEGAEDDMAEMMRKLVEVGLR